MEIKGFDKRNIEVVAYRVEEIMKQLEKEFNVKVTRKGGRYTSTSFNPKYEISLIVNGKVESRERTAFKESAYHYGLKTEWLDKTFIDNGTEFVVTGLRTSSKRYPVIAQNTRTKKFYKFSAVVVKRSFGE